MIDYDFFLEKAKSSETIEKTMKVSDNVLKEKSELKKLLNNYEGKISKQLIEYLNSLIELEFSVVKENIKEDDRYFLSELAIYRYAAIYNIYNRSLTLIKNTDLPFKIEAQNLHNNSLQIKTKLKDNFDIFLFDYNYDNNLFNKEKIKEGYNNRNIGEIKIYEALESKELREKEMYRILEELIKVYDDKGPAPSPFGEYGGPRSQWFFETEHKIKYLEKEFKKLDNKTELTENEKKEIEIKSAISKILLNDMGLTENDFEDVEYDPYLLINNIYSIENSELQKEKVKKLQNLTIERKIKYI